MPGTSMLLGFGSCTAHRYVCPQTAYFRTLFEFLSPVCCSSNAFCAPLSVLPLVDPFRLFSGIVPNRSLLPFCQVLVTATSFASGSPSLIRFLALSRPIHFLVSLRKGRLHILQEFRAAPSSSAGSDCRCVSTMSEVLKKKVHCTRSLRQLRLKI